MGNIAQSLRDTTKKIPDDLSTGCNESLLDTIITAEGTVNGFYYRFYSAGTVCGITFPSWNNSLIGTTVTIENTDFTNFPVIFANNDTLTSETTIVFNNCKFESITTETNVANMKIILNNCTVKSIGLASYITINSCKIGGSCYDGIRPLKYVTVNNSYFRRFDIFYQGAELHTDGLQVFGSAGIDAEEIYFNNCRFECMQYNVYQNEVLSNAYVNAPIMIQMEYSNGRNMKISDCIANGGGFTVYSWVKTNYIGTYTLSNVVLENVLFGESFSYDKIYSGTVNTTFTNCKSITDLYVSSVVRDANGNVTLYATNDTLTDKYLYVRNQDGFKRYKIPSTYSSKGTSKKPVYAGIDFDDFPIDVPIDCGVCDYIVCYSNDVSLSSQIRFENYTENPVEEFYFNSKLSLKLVNAYINTIYRFKKYLAQESLITKSTAFGTTTTTNAYFNFGVIADPTTITVGKTYSIKFDYEFTIGNVGTTPDVYIRYTQWGSSTGIATIPVLTGQTYTGSINTTRTATSQTLTYSCLFLMLARYCVVNAGAKITNLEVAEL